MLVIIPEWQDISTPGVISSVAVQGESDASVIAASKASFGSPANNRQICYHPNLTSGGSKTVTVTMTQSVYFTVLVYEYAGQDPASQPDAANAATGASGQPTLNLTTVANNALIVAACGQQGTLEPTAGSGFNLLGTRPNNGYRDEDEDDLDGSTAGSRAVAFAGTDGASGWWLAVASFKPAGGGATNWGRLLGNEINRLVRVVG
jgi:hypothetical protein